jgi:hypothetical protein
MLEVPTDDYEDQTENKKYDIMQIMQHAFRHFCETNICW